MVNFLDILLEFLIGISCIIVSVILLTGTDMPFLAFIPVLFYFFLHILLKRRKKIAQYLKEDFQKLGYRVLSERPTKFSETTLEIKPALLINGIPASRYGYIRKFERVFEVETNTNERFELVTTVTKSWSGNNLIDIRKRTKIMN